MQVTVLGASGGAGAAITAELHQRGHTVIAVSRSGSTAAPTGVRRVRVDVHDLAATMEACAGSDVVVLAVQPPYDDWFGTFELLVGRALAAAEATGARLVFVDNLYMYGAVDGPITEASPERATTPKGRLRAELGQRVLAAHHEGRVRTTIGRFSDYYGPGGSNSLLHNLQLGPALAGKTMRVFLDGTMPHTFHYLPDAARGFATLVERPDADGRAWILPAAPAPTQLALAGLINDLLPRPVRVRTVTRPMVTVGGWFSSLIRESKQVAEQFDRPWVVDASAFTAAFGAIALTDHRQALAETLAWMRATGAPTTAAVAA